LNLLSIGESTLAAARERVAGAKAEVFLMGSESRTSEWSEGQPENEVVARGEGAGIRLIQDGRLGFSHTNRLETGSLADCLQRAEAGARVTSADPHLGIGPGAQPLRGADSLELVDKSLDAAGWPQRAAFLETLEAEVKKRDKRFTKVLRASYREDHSQVAIVNSEGLKASYEGTAVSFTLACVAVQDGETQIGYGFHAARHLEDLQARAVIEKTAESTLALLGGKQIPSGRYDLILDPLVAAEMLGLFATALRGDQVLKGKSFLARRMGEAIGAPLVTMIDDGVLPRGLGSSPFDAEGAATQRTLLIQGGVLQNFLYDGYTARKAGKVSTGNAGRGSYKGAPEPDTNNFYLERGATAPERIISETDAGIYVRNVMGLHTVDTISGDFSLGIMGERIEKGKRTHGVRGVTIAGNLLDLLRNVESVGSDLVFFGSTGAPTLRIKDISVAGL
jgi:PmbA protein